MAKVGTERVQKFNWRRKGTWFHKEIRDDHVEMEACPANRRDVETAPPS